MKAINYLVTVIVDENDAETSHSIVGMMLSAMKTDPIQDIRAMKLPESERFKLELADFLKAQIEK